MAHTSVPPQSRIGLLDARQPRAATVVPDDPAFAAGPYHYLRLAPEMGQTTQCCVTGGGPATSAILRYPDEKSADTVAAAARAALFTPSVPEGFIGLQLAPGAGLRVLDPRRLLVWWPDRPALTRVDHCLSREGLHVQWREQAADGRWKRPQHYYLPLEMEVEPDCPSTIR